MRSRSKSAGSFARAARTVGAARNAVARTRKPARGAPPAAAKRERPPTSANRNELIAQPERHAAEQSMTRKPSSPSMTRGSVRLQKALADAGVAARRDCEQLIMDGRIQLNGVNVAELPCFIDPYTDVVAMDGVPLDLSASQTRQHSGDSEARTYVLINKPKGMITTARDPEGRPTVLQMVPHAIRERERLFPVGRLDADSTGLLLLTNDGDLAYQLTHPKFGVLKEYRVTTTGLADDEQLNKLKQGMYLLNPDGKGETRAKRTRLEGVRVLKRFVDRSRGNRTLLSITLREGQNREIRRLLARVGLKVRELERVAIGPLRAADLKPGQSKLLGKRDVEKLRGATLASAAR